MLNEVQADQPRAAYKVDAFAGGRNSEVSMQWMRRNPDERFASLDDLAASVKARHDASFESRVRSVDVDFRAPIPHEAADLHKLTLGVTLDAGDVKDAREIAPTNWAFGQLCQRAKAPTTFLRQLPSQLVRDTLTWRMRHDREVEELKLYGGAAELYAATGPDYGRIPDWEVVAAVQQVAGNGLGEMGWKTPGTLDWVTRMYDPEKIGDKDQRTFYSSDRDVFIFLVDDRNPIEVGKTKHGDPDLMFRGFYVQNSEVGSRALKLAAFYLRGVCMNRNLWGVEGFQEITIRHTRLAPDRWLQQCVPALNSYASGSAQKLIEGVAMAKAAKLADDDDAAIAFLRQRTFSTAAATAILKTGLEEEDRPVRSAWDFAQAITAYARNIPTTDDRLVAENEARKLLDKAAGVRPMAAVELEAD